MIEEATIEDVMCFQREAAIADKKYMSVTSVMRRAGLTRFYISRARLRELAQVGKDVHMVCADIAAGGTDYWSAIPTIAPYAVGFKKFLEETDFQVIESETKHKDEQLCYVGKIDLFGTQPAQRSRRQQCVWEIKKGGPLGWHALQTAAYERLLMGSRKFATLNRGAIYLSEFKYRLVRHNDPLDFAYFSAALTTARLREKWGLVNERDERDFDAIILGGGEGQIDESIEQNVIL